MEIKRRLKKIFAFVLFMAIISKVFLSATYLFRSPNINRYHFTGIAENPVDMVYVGASSTFVYWQALKAWNDYGITSYAYAMNSLQEECLEYCIKESQRLQRPNKPRLYVLDARTFLDHSEKLSPDWWEPRLRNASDSMDVFSPHRLGMIFSMLKHRPSDGVDKLSLFFDIITTHTYNPTAVASSAHWKFIDNRESAVYKGFEFTDRYRPISTPSGFETEKCANLSARTLDVLNSLLEYCRSQDFQVLFVVSPYSAISQEDQKAYNSISKLVMDSGFQFLNTNDYLDDMGIDFSTDVYDSYHVNCFGAEKYTAFLEKYIAETYSLPDHRENSDYAAWNEQYEQFTVTEQKYKTLITNSRLNWEAGPKIAKEMRQTTDFVRWATLAQDSRFCLLMAGKGEFPRPENRADKLFLATWNLNSSNYQNSIRVVSNTSILSSNPDEHTAILNGTVGTSEDAYSIDNQSGNASIQLRGGEQSLQGNGLNIVVYDQNYRTIVDSVTVQLAENGQLTLVR